MQETQLANLVQMNSVDAVLKEAMTILPMISSDLDPEPIHRVFQKTIDLYRGKGPETRACNTDYHDFQHITDTFLAMMRLVHGVSVSGEKFSDRQVFVCIAAALLHDSGYIQHVDDRFGTGAKYTTTHVRRSMEFIERNGSEYGLRQDEILPVMSMIHSTDLAVDIKTIPFPDKETEAFGKMLAVADLSAQMADRTYLEKLLFLYHEFDEARVGECDDEIALLNQTVGFYFLIEDRFKDSLDAVDQYMANHFKARWDINEDLYKRAIKNQQKYLIQVLGGKFPDPILRLRRSKIVELVHQKYGLKSKNRKLKAPSGHPADSGDSG